MKFDLLDKLSIDSSFTDNIKESSYVEKMKQINPLQPDTAYQTHKGHTNHTNHIKHTKHIKYSNFAPFIISIYDPLYEHIENNEKKIYMKKKVTEICSEIEEKSDVKYHNYHFNEKIMKPSVIQFGLQVPDKDYISSIYYLNEYYRKHFVIVYKNIAYETCIKNYPKEYLNYKDGCYIMITEGDYVKGDINDLLL